MKNQHAQTHRSSKLSLLVVTLVMLAALICSFTVMASAAGQSVSVDLDDLKIELSKDATGTYYKEYDGTTAVTVTLDSTNAELGIAAGDDVTVNVTAAFADKNVTNDNKNYINVSLELTGADAGKYTLAAKTVTVGAYVAPKKLTWATDAEVAVPYKPDSTTYTASANVPALNGILDADKASVAKTVNVTVQASKVGTVATTAVVDLGANYTVDPLKVNVKVEAVKITAIEWSEYDFAINDKAAHEITVYGKDAAGNKYLLKVNYPADYATTPDKWYEISVAPVDANIVIADGVGTTKTVHIQKATYKVGMNDTVFAGNANAAQNPTTYMISVFGLGNNVLPVDVLNLITYTVEGSSFTGTSKAGTYNIVAVLPDGYKFVDADGKEYNNTDNKLTATLTVNFNAVTAANEEMPYQIILTGTTGVSPSISATVSEPELARKAIKGFPRHEGYKVTVTNAGTGAYSIVIGINDSLVHTRADALTVNDLYIYDQVSGTMIKASERYTVTMKDGYYEVAGISGDVTLTFVIAPVYHVSFWLTAPGIALIILLIIALIIVLILIGLAKRKEKKNAEKEEEPEEIEPIVPDTVDEEEVLEELADEAAEEIADDVAAEEEATEENAEGTDEAAAEAMATLVEEASEEVLETEEEDTTDVAEEMAEEIAQELADEVEAEDAEAEADADALAAAVAEAMEDTLNESADATDAVALEEESVEVFAAVEESDDDDDNDDDDDDDNGFAGFSTAGLKFIDIKAEPETYQEMLAQEQNGEVQLVYRYRRSYMSRMIQSQGSVQEYYNIIKNALLSFKGIKGRTSWNYEAFNRGRVHVAKMNAKTKTLYLYLALDPEELQDTKYGIIDVSSKKKYASVPVLMKIKGDRKFKYALELIEKLCGEQLQLPKLANAEEVDYTVPYQTTDELVESGLVKKLCAAVPLNPPTEEPAEEVAAVEEAPATETENVTFVEPTDAPAVVAAAEEVAAEEPATETVAEAENAEEPKTEA